MSIDQDRPGDVEVISPRRTIVAALPLKRAGRERLATLLDADVFDVRDRVDHADLVLTPACSPRLIANLRTRYRAPRVIVVELDDWELDIELAGPVKRILRSGADAYVLADSLEELAYKISTPDERTSQRAQHRFTGELTEGSTVDDLIEAFLRESIQYSTRQQVAVQDRRPEA